MSRINAELFDFVTKDLDWVEVYHDFLKSNYSVEDYYNKSFKDYLVKTYKTNLLPNFSCLNRHFRNIRIMGEFNYSFKTNGKANAIFWQKVLDEYNTSDFKSYQEFFEYWKEANHCNCGRSTFFRKIKILKEEVSDDKKNEVVTDSDNTIDDTDEKVNVFTLPLSALESPQNKIKISSSETCNANTPAEIKVTVGGTTISFASLTPEDSVLKLIKALHGGK